MGKLTRVIPATEVVERSITISRAQGDDLRAWGALNDIYLQELPAQADWTFLMATSALSTSARYITGTATVNTGATAVTFTGATIPSGTTGWRMRFNDNPNVYDWTFVSSSNGTIAPALSEDRNISGGAFTLFNPYYTLATNFDRFPKNGGLQLWQGAKPTPVPEMPIQEYFDEFSASPGRPAKCQLIAPDTLNRAQVELVPPPDKVYLMPYHYIYAPTPLRETTGGVATVAASGTGATFQGAVRVGEMVTGMYFRIDNFGEDADSEWHQIVSVSAANSNVTFQSTFTTSAANSANYTVCNVPVYPLVLHGALLHGVVKRLLADQNDKTFIYTDSLQTAAINDAKRLFRTRTYNQEIETVFDEYHYRR